MVVSDSLAVYRLSLSLLKLEIIGCANRTKSKKFPISVQTSLVWSKEQSKVLKYIRSSNLYNNINSYNNFRHIL